MISNTECNNLFLASLLMLGIVNYSQSELSVLRFHTLPSSVQQEPRLVQLLSPPHLGNTHLNAGPAQFGMDLKTVNGVCINSNHNVLVPFIYIRAHAISFQQIYQAELNYLIVLFSQIVGRLAVAQPYRACTSLVNVDSIRDKIVIMERGDCMFIDKARIIQQQGALGGIVIGK